MFLLMAQPLNDLRYAPKRYVEAGVCLDRLDNRTLLEIKKTHYPDSSASHTERDFFLYHVDWTRMLIIKPSDLCVAAAGGTEARDLGREGVDTCTARKCR